VPRGRWSISSIEPCPTSPIQRSFVLRSKLNRHGLRSPIAAISDHSLHLRIEAPSSWDSNIVPLFLIESLIAAVVNLHWPESQRRIKELESLVEAQAKSGKRS